MCRGSIVALFAAALCGACADDTRAPSDGAETSTGGSSPSNDGGEDGAPSPDAGVAPTTCIVERAFESPRESSCNTARLYRCGDDRYAIDCHCPKATCTCRKNREPVTMVPFDGCPSCEADFKAAAEQCGFPAPGDVVAPPGDE